MSHSDRAKHSLFAASANTAETAINTEQDTDTTFMIDISNVPNTDPRRESNVDEQNGREEADEIYDNGKLASFDLNFNKAQAQHIAFIMAYALGTCSSVADGSGYNHSPSPINGNLDSTRANPSFTGVYRYGNAILKRRFASFFVDSFSLKFEEDNWVQLSASLKGTGKITPTVIEEEIVATLDAVSLNLAANGVQGATAEERMDNIHSIVAETSAGVWEEVAFSAVSDATPAVITITAPGATADACNFEVLYVPTEDAWCAFPPRVSESALKVAQTQVNVGGTWNGSAFVGGRDISSDLKSIEYSFSNSLQVKFGFGAGGSYASKCSRDGREQVLKFSKDFRNYILQNHIDKNDTFGVRIYAYGAMFEDPHQYEVELIFPKVGVLSLPISVDGKTLAEAGDLAVLEDSTYGTVIARIKNQVAGYAA